MVNSKPPIPGLGKAEPPHLDQHEDANLLRELQPARIVNFTDIIAQRLDPLRWRKAEDGAPSPRDLTRIHKYLYDKLYLQAGNYRGIRTDATLKDISSIMGARSGRLIAGQIAGVFENLKKQDYLTKAPKEEMVFQLANIIESINKIDPFYNGTALASLVMANHVAQFAWYELDLFSTGAMPMKSAMTSMREHGDLMPLREIIRAASRPWKALAFAKFIKEGNMLALRSRPLLRPAYSIVEQAIGDVRNHGRFSYDSLTAQQKAVIRRVQTELDAGRLNKMPSGAEKAWYLGMQIARGR